MFAHSHISSPLIPLAYFRTHIENPSFDTLLFTFKTCDCCWLMAKVSDLYLVQFDKLILTAQQPKYHQNRWTYARVFLRGYIIGL
jgi:hypothetical protein